jgi:hypothetical protein
LRIKQLPAMLCMQMKVLLNPIHNSTQSERD